MASMPDDLAAEHPTPGQPRARAVFSPDDFALIKDALGAFIRTLPDDDPRGQQATRLYHRLGRVD